MDNEEKQIENILTLPSLREDRIGEIGNVLITTKHLLSEDAELISSMENKKCCSSQSGKAYG